MYSVQGGLPALFHEAHAVGALAGRQGWGCGWVGEHARGARRGEHSRGTRRGAAHEVHRGEDFRRARGGGKGLGVAHV